MLSTKHFEGQQNLTQGSRNGSDKVLAELLNQKKSVFISAEQTGTGSEQDIAHTLKDENGNAVAPSAVLLCVTDDNNAAFALVQGTHTASVLKVTATASCKFQALAIY